MLSVVCSYAEMYMTSLEYTQVRALRSSWVVYSSSGEKGGSTAVVTLLPAPFPLRGNVPFFRGSTMF